MAPLLGERWAVDDITVAIMHPGWADTPGVQESLPRFRAITRPVLRDDAQGADTSVWLAAVEPPPPTGRFWHDRVERPTSLLPSTRPEARPDRAWAWLRTPRTSTRARGSRRRACPGTAADPGGSGRSGR